jgi:hypothetical protein
VVLVPRRPRKSAAKSSTTTSTKTAVPNQNITHHNSVSRAAAGPCGSKVDGVFGGLIATLEQALTSKK